MKYTYIPEDEWNEDDYEQLEEKQRFCLYCIHEINYIIELQDVSIFMSIEPDDWEILKDVLWEVCTYDERFSNSSKFNIMKGKIEYVLSGMKSKFYDLLERCIKEEEDNDRERNEFLKWKAGQAATSIEVSFG